MARPALQKAGEWENAGERENAGDVRSRNQVLNPLRAHWQAGRG